jgi:hypothetical protein
MYGERKAVRKVIESGLVPKGGRPKLWAYGYEDLAQLFGTTAEGIRCRVKRGTFDPGDLEDICRAWYERAVHGTER